MRFGIHGLIVNWFSADVPSFFAESNHVVKHRDFRQRRSKLATKSPQSSAEQNSNSALTSICGEPRQGSKQRYWHQGDFESGVYLVPVTLPPQSIPTRPWAHLWHLPFGSQVYTHFCKVFRLSRSVCERHMIYAIFRRVDEPSEPSVIHLKR